MKLGITIWPLDGRAAIMYALSFWDSMLNVGNWVPTLGEMSFSLRGEDGGEEGGGCGLYVWIFQLAEIGCLKGEGPEGTLEGCDYCPG